MIWNIQLDEAKNRILTTIVKKQIKSRYLHVASKDRNIISIPLNFKST